MKAKGTALSLYMAATALKQYLNVPIVFIYYAFSLSAHRQYDISLNYGDSLVLIGSHELIHVQFTIN